MPIDIAILLLATIGLLFLAIYRWAMHGELRAFRVAVILPMLLLVVGMVLRAGGDAWSFVFLITFGGPLAFVLFEILRSQRTRRRTNVDAIGFRRLRGPSSRSGFEVDVQVGPATKDDLRFVRVAILCDGIELFDWEEDRTLLGPAGVDGLLSSMHWRAPGVLGFATGGGEITITNDEGEWYSSDSVWAEQVSSKERAEQ